MPLQRSLDPEIVANNLRELIVAGYSPEIAVAIANEYAAGKDRAAGIAYVCGDCVLMLLRSADSDQPLSWAFVGGKIEKDETPEQAARRESQEEIGRMPEGELRFLDWHDGFVTFACDVPDQFAPTLNDEHIGYVWMPLSLLPLQPLHTGCAVTLSRAPMRGAPGIVLDAKIVDGNGWAEIKDCPISKVGVFPYMGYQIGKTGRDAKKIFQVLRPEEELSDPACVDSFRMLPLIDDHVMLGPVMKEITDDATDAEKKGIHGVIGDGVFYENGFLRGNIKIFSNTLSALIQSGKKELSAGYRCIYDLTAGVWNEIPFDAVQRQMRGNHLALVQRGRMGPDVAIMDHECFDLTSDTEPNTMANETTNTEDPNAPKKEEGEGKSKDYTLSEITAIMKDVIPKIDALAAAAKPAEAKVDETAAVEDTAAAVEAALKLRDKRDQLAKKLTDHVGTFDAAEMSFDQVVAYGCEKLKITADKGQEAATLNGFLMASPIKSPAAVVAADKAADPSIDKIAKFNKGA